MKKKKITVSIDSTYKYLQIWNGIFNLTNKELQILSAFIDVNNKKSINLCSIPNKKKVAAVGSRSLLASPFFCKLLKMLRT